jgi:hypothetical protein
MQEKFIDSLNIATKLLQTADHLTYITFPLVKEKRLLLKILAELSNSLLNAINAILQYEYYWKRIQIYKDARENFRTFKNIAKRYDISPEQLLKINEIINLAEKHKKSPFEFVRNDKIVIMSDTNQADYLTLEKIKSFLIEAKDILRKINLKIKT